MTEAGNPKKYDLKDLQEERVSLVQEAKKLTHIFGAIVTKSE
jgi:hypothetical protein